MEPWKQALTMDIREDNGTECWHQCAHILKSGDFVFQPPPNISKYEIVIKNATWYVCQDCGEQILPSELSRKIEREGRFRLNKFFEFLEKVKELTLIDKKGGQTVDDMLRHLTSELGEVAEAISVERGQKNKKLTESSKVESIDLMICSLALYYLQDGDNEELAEIGFKKLEKWENTQKTRY